MSKNYIATITNEMYRWFDMFNEEFFDGELERPVITIQKTRANNLGHFTLDRVWTNAIGNDIDDNETVGFYEINVSAQSLNREINDICGTLLHEMCHLSNKQKEIKDCSGKIHNKKFKLEAERVGFEVERDKRVGWGYTSNSPRLDTYISETIKPDANVFNLYRSIVPTVKGPTQKRVFKYVCPQCGQKLNGKEGCNVICGKCNTPFEMEE